MTSTALDVLGGGAAPSSGSTTPAAPSQPQDATAWTQAYDIFPWRTRPDISVPFVIGGVGFGSLATTALTIGRVAATIASVSPTRIRGDGAYHDFTASELLEGGLFGVDVRRRIGAPIRGGYDPRMMAAVCSHVASTTFLADGHLGT